MHASRSRLHSGSRLRFDVGTLWTLERDAHVARCALIWLPHAWELRVLIDDDTLLSERCRTQHGVFAVAGAWQAKLREVGWDEPSATYVPTGSVEVSPLTLSEPSELIRRVGHAWQGASPHVSRVHTDARVRLKTRNALVAQMRRQMHFTYVQDDIRLNDQVDAQRRPALRVRDADVGSEQRADQLRSGDPHDGRWRRTARSRDRALVNPDRNNFGPRLGFAYTPVAEDRASAAAGASATSTSTASARPNLLGDQRPAGRARRRSTRPARRRPASSRPSRATRPG